MSTKMKLLALMAKGRNIEIKKENGDVIRGLFVGFSSFSSRMMQIDQSQPEAELAGTKFGAVQSVVTAWIDLADVTSVSVGGN